MRRGKQFFVILLCLALFAGIFGGCAEPEPVPEDTGDLPAADTTPEEQQPETPEANEITDMAGRTVVLPDTVETGFSTGAVGSMMLYMLDPSVMVGVNYEFNAAEAEFILEEYRALPAFGQGEGLNLEAMVAAAPDVLIICGSVSDSTIADTDAIEEQTGIPCVMLDGSLEAVPAAFRLMGDVFGLEDRSEQLAVYAEEALAFADSLAIPEEERVSVYYGNGTANLETAPQGSSHAELFDVVGVNNVAVIEGEADVSAPRIDVSAEQVIGWNPAVVILNGEPTENVSPADAVEAFIADENYRNVDAVANDRVYAIPKYPFSWFDRPPGPNRLIGIYWLTGILYPDAYSGDIREDAIEFYNLYYHMDLSEEQLTSLLGF